jgi:hypothetical protein
MKKNKEIEEETGDYLLKRMDLRYRENDEFNDSLDGEDNVEIESPFASESPYQYRRSEVLYWTDNEAYEAEYIAWQNSKKAEEHTEAVKHIKDTEQHSVFLDMAKAIGKKRTVPFIGAGLSAPMGMPTWAKALSLLNSRIDDPSSADVEELISATRYLDAADILFKTNPEIAKNFVRTTYRVTKIDGALRLLPALANGCVVTTNFDDAIEHVMNENATPFDSYMHGTEEHNFFPRLTRGERCLLKLHGDYDNQSTYILSGDQYNKAYGDPFSFSSPIPKALRQIYISTTLLFLGCSLGEDMTLRLFRAVKESREYEVPIHYAILPTPPTKKLISERSSFLLSLNIQPIWYPGQDHSFVERYLRLAVDMASEVFSL